MPPANYYNIDDYINNKIGNSINYELPENVLSIIKLLEKIVAQSEANLANEKPIIKKHIPKIIVDRRRNNASNFVKGSTNKDIDGNDWKTVQPQYNFKPVKIEVKEGFDKQINDIRIALNKLSNKNIETQKSKIIELINEILEDDISSENIKTIAKIIFDVAIANKFFSEIYADLYKELSNSYEIFKTQVNDILENYKEIFKTIQYIDSNVDYDGYCNSVKKSDIRKANSSLIVNLTKKEVLLPENVIDIILYLQEIIIEYSKEPSKTNEVEEISDNLFIIMIEGSPILSKSEQWTSIIIPKVVEMTKLKKEHGADHPSMTNRAVFKCIDILDKLKISLPKK